MVVNIFIELEESRLSKCHFTWGGDWLLELPTSRGYTRISGLGADRESWPSELKHFTCSG